MGIQGSRARSHAHGKRHRRLIVHLMVVALAIATVGYVTYRPKPVASFPSIATPAFAMSGLSGPGMPRDAAVLRTPGSNVTLDSITTVSIRADTPAVRAVGGVSPTASFSSGVASAAVNSGEQGAGVKPLADILDPTKPFLIYQVQPGDTMSIIAQRYGITLKTLFDNNPTVGTDSANLLKRGQELVVPRKDGIMYKVASGDTVKKIVDQYDNITVATALEYRPNNIQGDGSKLEAGTYVLLPGATIKPPPPPPPEPPKPVAVQTTGNGQGSPPKPSGGRFTSPLAAYRGVSDPFGVDRGGGTYHTGIDLDLYGLYHSNIFSACNGVVVKTEYLTYSYGYHVIVDCGDGFSTLYAHMSQIKVTPGQQVSQGTILGISGVTGFTTGEHLHFEIRINGAPVNPALYLKF
jgi:murein DD-endopeptidase MepM/ murein hydrolase activator NlpD